MPRAKKRDVWELAEEILQAKRDDGHLAARRILLYGGPGTGKTHVGNYSGVTDSAGVFPITLHPDMPAAELKGHYIPKGDVFHFKYGIAVEAAVYAKKHGWARLVINELDHAEEDVLSFLYVVLDDPQTAKVTLPTGEVINFPESLQIVATMNGEPEDLLPALQDRFPVTININTVHPEAVAMLSKDLQAAAKSSASVKLKDRRASIRVYKEFDLLRRHLPEETAAFACFGERANDFLTALQLERAPSPK